MTLAIIFVLLCLVLIAGLGLLLWRWIEDRMLRKEMESYFEERR